MIKICGGGVVILMQSARTQMDLGYALVTVDTLAMECNVKVCIIWVLAFETVLKKYLTHKRLGVERYTIFLTIRYDTILQ